MTCEMRRTILWFKHQATKWNDRAENSEKGQKWGHAAYAWKQVETWQKLQKNASEEFSKRLELTEEQMEAQLSIV